MKYDYLIFIGRFQPFHIAHLQMVEKALQHGEKLILFCGSANLPRSARNPWLFSERETMINETLPTDIKTRVIIRPLNDNPYHDDDWTADIHQIVAKIAPPNSRIALFGHVKDSSSYYLKMFPEWDFISAENIHGISATPLRTRYFLESPVETFHEPLLPDSVEQFLNQFKKSPSFPIIAAETRYITDYKKAWSVAPYPPIFTTTDALVYCAGHILLVERGGQPGKGLFALPGGFLNPDESLAEGCLRELAEETGLILEKSDINAVYPCDKPDRSIIGRVITHLHSFYLPTEVPPNVKGSDDAARAFWYPVEKLTAEQFHDDHYFLIEKYLPR